MESDLWRWSGALGLIALNGFFVAAEYALVGSRKSRIEAMAKKGGRFAKVAQDALNHLDRYIAGIQVCITMCGLALGAYGESVLSATLHRWLGGEGSHVIATILSFLAITFLTVSVGELVPKYVTIRDPERWAIRITLPLKSILTILRPLTYLLEKSATLLLKPFKIQADDRTVVAKEELAAMIFEGASAGEFRESHARFVTRALRLTDLQADDIMVPRVDVGTIDVNASREELVEVISKYRHTRLLVIDGDPDEVVGILHVQDAFKLMAGDSHDIRAATRPAVFVPPTVTLDRLIETMRSRRTQILVVRDEHGGTEGILTLEDIVEEIFGELDDQLEAEVPRIELRSDGRIVMRADVRTDELCEFLAMEDNPMERESMSTILQLKLDRTPRVGDAVETPFGTLKVDNMARQRVTRVSLTPRRDETA